MTPRRARLLVSGGQVAPMRRRSENKNNRLYLASTKCCVEESGSQRGELFIGIGAKFKLISRKRRTGCREKEVKEKLQLDTFN